MRLAVDGLPLMERGFYLPYRSMSGLCDLSLFLALSRRGFLAIAERVLLLLGGRRLLLLRIAKEVILRVGRCLGDFLFLGHKGPPAYGKATGVPFLIGA